MRGNKMVGAIMPDDSGAREMIAADPAASTPILVDVVYRRLMAAIIDCSLLPGQRIRQAEIAQTLGVSRAPVSHALQLLKYQGLLQDSGRRGLEVAPVDPDRVRDLYQVRAALDAVAARLTAARCAEGRLSAADIALIDKAFESGMKLSAETPMSVRVQADIDFHHAIYLVSGNRSIAETLQPLWPHLQRAMVLVLQAHETRELAWREHRQIMACILAGDPEGSAHAAYRHAANAGTQTEERLRRAADGA